MTRVIRQIYLSTLVTGEFSMNIKSLAIGAMMAVCSVASFAASTVYTNSNINGLSYSFSTADTSSLFSASFMSFDPFTVTLDGTSTNWTHNADSSSWSWDIANTIGAGNHTLAITGNMSPVKGSYQYVPGTITAPVPEPETYAMMLAGLGALGFLGRRRKTA
jgi:hypothetical protein